MDSWGTWSSVAFVAVYAVMTVALVPGAIPSVAAGVLFGTIHGSILVVIGATIGAILAFLLARGAGRPLAMRFAHRHVARIDAYLGNHGFFTVLIARLVPIVPFSTSNYVFGLTAVSGRFTAATAVRIVHLRVVRRITPGHR